MAQERARALRPTIFALAWGFPFYIAQLFASRYSCLFLTGPAPKPRSKSRAKPEAAPVEIVGR